jgi:CRP-like cAMP-binding protein
VTRTATTPTTQSADALDSALDRHAQALVDLRAQALEDLAFAETASVCFVRHRGGANGERFFDALEDRALSMSFVVARVSIFESRAFDALDVLVRACVKDLRSSAKGSKKSARGIVSLLDAFIARNDERALAAFDEGARLYAAGGDVTALCRAYIEASQNATREAARIDAWFEGTSVARAESAPVALGALSAENAQRALSELSTIVKVLGHHGLALFFERGESLAKLPAARRERAYVVLREVIDNADGAGGLRSTHIVVGGSDALFEGPRSIESLEPLRTRVASTSTTRALPPPHAPLVVLEPKDPPPVSPTITVSAPSAGVARGELRSLIRASQGLPPIEAVDSLSVGLDRIDRTIDELFALSANAGSVFSLITGPYGSGKTHLLLHLERRALAEKRPVFRLSLEQLSVDLGAPQRHLRRLLAHSKLPLPQFPSALDVLERWTRSPRSLERLIATLGAFAKGANEELADVARVALRGTTGRAARPALALSTFLGTSDLESKTTASNYRQAAYDRLLLWLALLEAMEGCAGPIVIVDEAENLYRSGVSRVDRRTALRSLSFYCGGTLPRACVVTALTPDSLVSLRDEAPALLDEVSEQKGTLPCEDATMFARRLKRTKPTEVEPLTTQDRERLALRLYAMHERVRGEPAKLDLDELLATIRSDTSPRALVRTVIDALERAHFERATLT